LATINSKVSGSLNRHKGGEDQAYNWSWTKENRKWKKCKTVGRCVGLMIGAVECASQSVKGGGQLE